MFTAYGWIEVWDKDRSDQFGDRDSRPLRGTVEAVTALVEAHSYAATMRTLNGTLTVQIAVGHNHRGDYVPELFRQVGEMAPGSFGSLHVSDDEAENANEWMRLVMARGRVTVEVDRGLSPRVPKLEDD